MKRYFLKEIMRGSTHDGSVSDIFATVEYESDGEIKYLTCMEIGGNSVFYLSDKDIFHGIVEDDFSDKNDDIFLNSNILNFDGIDLWCYENTFLSMKDNPNVSAVSLIRYLITLVSCRDSEIDGLINMAKGKYADELDVPVSRIEKYYLDLR